MEFQGMHSYYLSLLRLWILPPRLNFLFIIVGFLISQHLKLAGQIIIAIAFISLWSFCTPITAQLLFNHLQYQYPQLQINKIVKKNPSAIIVLGGGSWTDPTAKYGYDLSIATKERLRYAAQLYHQTHFPIITSGGAPKKTIPPESELMKKGLWDYFKTPVTWQENKSRNTKDEGMYMVPILQMHHIKTAYLITDAWHMPRSMHIFDHFLKNTGTKMVAAPMGYTVLLSKKKVSNYLPSFNALNMSITMMHEYIGMLANRLAYVYG